MMTTRLRPGLLASLVAGAVVVGSLAGCAGFEPLYGSPAVTGALKAIDLTVPQTRMGFLLREQVNDELARDLETPARYRLNLTANEQRFPRGLRVNNIATEYELNLRVNYQLINTMSGRVVTQGGVPVTVFYASADAPYAGIASQEDAQQRAAAQAAIQLRLELSRFFNRRARPSS